MPDGPKGAAFDENGLSGGKALAAFRPARIDNGTTTTSRHTGTETVSARALKAAWLESTLHYCNLNLYLESGSKKTAVIYSAMRSTQEDNFIVYAPFVQAI